MRVLKLTNRSFGLFLGVILFLLTIVFCDFMPGNRSVTYTAAVAILMAALWISEAVPLAVTSLIPLILFPLLGVLSGKETAEAYINSTIFLFMGGFIIAIAMEKWNLHKRIALNLISFFGVKPQRIILGFMVAAAFISLWISNTATAVMLLPIAMAILSKVDEGSAGKSNREFAVALMLGIAYACSVGGVGTLIGTPPNLVFQRIYSISFPDKPDIVFSQWMFYGIPLALFMLTFIWMLLTKILFSFKGQTVIDAGIIKNEKAALGKMSFEEKSVAVVFILAVLLWTFRSDIILDDFTLPGWSSLIPFPELIDDGTVAIFLSVLLFILPARVKINDDSSGSLLGIDTFRKIPWEIILLFGGGFALAEGFVQSGLSEIIGRQFASLSGVPVIFIIFAICFTITFLTELTSNTATAQILLPILASLSVVLKINPELLMIPATISASMAFMLPVATPPNAIIFGSGKLRVKDMARPGLIINLTGAVVITLFSYFFIEMIF